MMAVALASLVLGAGAVLWVEPSTTHVFPESPARSDGELSMRLYGARGEFESFQIAVHAKKGDSSIVAVGAGGVGPDIPAPQVWAVGYVRLTQPSGRIETAREVWPDRLLPFQKLSVPEGQTRALWLTYRIPRWAKPGVYATTVTVSIEPGRTVRIPLTIEVFDWLLPDRPELKTLFAVDLADAPSDAEEIKRLYRLLGAYRLGISPCAARASGPALPCEQLLSWAIAEAHVAALALDANDLAPDSLGAMADWFAARDRLGDSLLRVEAPSSRAQWPGLRAELQRLHAVAPRIRRLAVVPLSPYFDRFVDIWPLPLFAYQPEAVNRLRRGFSLGNPVPRPAKSVTASSQGAHPFEPRWTCLPEDAYDGCLSTVWWTGEAVSKRREAWLEIQFETAVDTDTFEVEWAPGYGAEEIEVHTSYEGRSFSRAEGRWEHHFATNAYQRSWSVCTLRIEKHLQALRLEFDRAANGGLLGVAEIQFPQQAREETPPLVEAPEFWLELRNRHFPSLSPATFGIEARLIPWVCWNHAMEGLLGGTLDAWPGRREGDPSAEVIEVQGGGEAWPLFYRDGEGGLAPSIRLERLRDGLEDYDYLALGARAQAEGAIQGEAVREALEAGLFLPDPGEAALDAWPARIAERRLALGRALRLREEPAP